MRGVAFAAVAIATLPLAFAGGDFMDCPTDGSVPVMTLAVRAMTARLTVFDGLQAGDFAVTSGRIPPRVCGFIHGRWPVSIGILMDTSGSMATPGTHSVSLGPAAADRLLAFSGPQDEYFLVWINDGAKVRVPFTKNLSRIRAGFPAEPRGRTALIDGLYLALNEMRKAQYPTRALVVLSDGLDNHSAFAFDELMTAYSESPVPVFLLAPVDPWSHPHPSDERNKDAIVRLVSKSGGYAVASVTDEEMQRAAASVASAIRLPYLLYFSVAGLPAERHTVQVEVKGIHPRPRLFYGDAVPAHQQGASAP